MSGRNTVTEVTGR